MVDSWDGSYYKQFSSFQQSKALELLRNFPFKGSERVLDIGCGPGTISKWIADQLPNGSVIGIDPSMGMLSQAFQDYQSVPNLQFLCRKAEAFQFDEPFHLITSFHALHFVKDHQKVFENMRSSLAKGGHIFLRMAEKKQPAMLELMNRDKWKSTAAFAHRVFPLSLDRAVFLLESLGLTILRANVDQTPYVFPSQEAMKQWVLGWLGHASGLSGDMLEEFTKELMVCLMETQGEGERPRIGFYSLEILATLK